VISSSARGWSAIRVIPTPLFFKYPKYQLVTG
jgi:hypothetical protein